MQKRSKKLNAVVYKEGLSEEDISKIQQYAALNMSTKKMAALLGLNRIKYPIEDYRDKDPRVAEAMERGPALLEFEIKTQFVKWARNGCRRSAEYVSKNILKIEQENSLRITVAPDIVYRSTVRADGSLIQEVLEEGRVIDAEATEKE